MKKKGYTYFKMKKDLERLSKRYDLEIFSLGKSVLEKEIYAFRLGRGENTVIYNAGHHGLEWITSLLLMRFAEDYLNALEEGELLCCKNIKSIYENSSIYIVPMVNPDGIEISLCGAKKYENWQANARGVDLNHNYDFGFEEQKVFLEELNIKGPGPTRYGGEYALSEPESRALVYFTEKVSPKLVIAYHSQGEVIYYKSGTNVPKNAEEIGQKFSQMSGYLLDETEGVASYGGYKDWFIDKFSRPGYTIEVGMGKNPLPITDIGDIINKNYEILLTAPFL